MRKFYLIGLISAFVFLLSACDNSFSLKKSVLAPKEKEISGPVLAQVNDWRIGLEDFEKRLKALEPLAKQQDLDITDVEFKRKALDELVRAVLLAEEAKDRGIDKKKDIVEAVESYKQTLLAESLIAEALKDVDVTDVEIDNFYNQNKDYFRKPEQVKVREIVVNDKSAAQNLYIRILQNEDFSVLATQNSVAASASKGGDLGYLTYDPASRFKKFWEVAFTLDKGEISSIFQGEDNKFYIIKIEDKMEGKATPLEEIKENIKQALKLDKENKKLDELVNSVKKKAKVVVNGDLLK